MFDDEVVCATTSLTLNNVLFVPKFPVSLLFTTQIIKYNKYSITFFPTYFIFQDF